MLDFNKLNEIRKKREKFEKKLNKLFERRKEINAKLEEIKPATTIPISFSSDELEYNFDSNILVPGGLDISNLSEGKPFQMGCPPDYTGEISNGTARCNLSPQNQKSQNKLIEIEKEIVKFETKLKALSKLEEYILSQQRSCDYINNENKTLEDYD